MRVGCLWVCRFESWLPHCTMRRLLLVAVLVAASRGEAQKRNEWSWGDDGEEAKPKEEKKVSSRSTAFHPAPHLINAPAPHLTSLPGHAIPPSPGAPLISPAPHVSALPGHPISPAPHEPITSLPHSISPAPHLSALPGHPISPAPHGHPSIAPVVTGHQLRGEDRSVTVGAGDGNTEGRFIKEKLCELGLAYDCHKAKGYKGAGYSHHDISYVQPVQVVAVGGPIAAVPVHHKGYGYKGKGYGVPVSYPAAAPPVYHPPPAQPSYWHPPPAVDYGVHGAVNHHKHTHTHKHLYDAYSGVYGKDNSYGSSSTSHHGSIDKHGQAVNPFSIHSQRPSPFPGNSIHSSSSPFLNDCECVDASFCSPFDVIPRSNDIRPFISARNKRTETLSTAGEKDESAAGSKREVKSEDEDKTSTRRRRDTIIFEDDDKRPERDTMVFRETFSGLGLHGGPALSNSRQGLGAQFGGSSPCGFGRVCCRNPIYRRQRAISTCGRKRNSVGNLGRVKTTRFEEGDTDFGEYPWHGAILRRDGGENVYVCGAALIDSRHLLTAAHCITGLTAGELKIRLGEWDVGGKTEFYKHFDTNVAGLYSHPDFYAGNLQNDIAVIKVQTPVDLISNPHIAPVCLPDRASTYTHQRCHVSGWGKDAFGSRGSFQHRLKEVDLPMVDRGTCQSAFRRTKLGRQFVLHGGMICAGGEQGKDACEGDGGSPLVCQNGDGSVELAGLVSWGLGCGERGIPGVYTNVPYYLDWIRSITRT